MSSSTSRSGLILLSHGSKDPVWRGNAERLLALVQAQHPEAAVACAYLDWCEPTLQQALQTLLQDQPQLTQVTIWPLLFGVGKHAREDIPALVQQLAPQFAPLQLHIAPAMGEDERVMQLLASLAGAYLQA